MEKLGYVLYELPVFFLVMWFGIRLVHFRRFKRNQPIFSEADKQLLFERPPVGLQSPVFRLRLARAILAATAATYLERRRRTAADRRCHHALDADHAKLVSTGAVILLFAESVCCALSNIALVTALFSPSPGPSLPFPPASFG